MKANDGNVIQHYLVKPDTTAKATIFVFQGSGSKVANWLKVVKPLVDDGFQLFLMEYRGFGESQGNATHQNVLHDAYKAFEYLRHRHDVKDKPLLVLGQSYGGQLAINVSTRFQQHLQGLIIEGTYTSFSEEAAYSAPKPISWLVIALVKDHYTSIDLIKSNNLPKLIVHSEDDDIVPVSMAKALHENAGGQKSLWLIKGGHIDGFIDLPNEFVTRINGLSGL